MEDPLAQQINRAASVLIVIPTDIDFAAIYAGVAMGQAIKNKPVTILNDAVTTNKLLIYKLKNFKFNALHTRATRSFTLVINKETNKIKRSFIDETDEKISLSLETEAGEINPGTLVEFKQSKIDQDLVIILGGREEKMPLKYSRILDKQPPEKTIYISRNQLWAEKVISFFDKIVFDEFSLTILLASLITQTRGLASFVNGFTLELVKQLISYGANYNDAFNVATSYINNDESGFCALEITNAKNMGGGIYYSHVTDTDNLYPIKPPYVPLMTHFADCRICFTMISKKNCNYVFLVNNKERFSLDSIYSQYGGRGDNSYLFFKSKIDAKELGEDIIRKLIAIINGNTFASRGQPSPDLEKGVDEPAKFTQGLIKGDPLSPAEYMPTVEMPVENMNIGGGDTLKIMEEA